MTSYPRLLSKFTFWQKKIDGFRTNPWAYKPRSTATLCPWPLILEIIKVPCQHWLSYKYIPTLAEIVLQFMDRNTESGSVSQSSTGNNQIMANNYNYVHESIYPLINIRNVRKKVIFFPYLCLICLCQTNSLQFNSLLNQTKVLALNPDLASCQFFNG